METSLPLRSRDSTILRSTRRVEDLARTQSNSFHYRSSSAHTDSRFVRPWRHRNSHKEFSEPSSCHDWSSRHTTLTTLHCTSVRTKLLLNCLMQLLAPSCLLQPLVPSCSQLHSARVTRSHDLPLISLLIRLDSPTSRQHEALLLTT